jgi:Helix-turn-helix
MTWTDIEIADAHIPPHDLTPSEMDEAIVELRAFRMARLRDMTDEQRLKGDLLRLRFQMENYVDDKNFNEKYSFSYFLQQYLQLIGKKQVEFAKEISLHPSKLNLYLNDKSDPSLSILYRLEKHTAEQIPALLWWKIIVKKMVNQIKNDKSTRQTEREKVNFVLQV